MKLQKLNKKRSSGSNTIITITINDNGNNSKSINRNGKASKKNNYHYKMFYRSIDGNRREIVKDEKKKKKGFSFSVNQKNSKSIFVCIHNNTKKQMMKIEK